MNILASRYFVFETASVFSCKPVQKAVCGKKIPFLSARKSVAIFGRFLESQGLRVEGLFCLSTTRHPDILTPKNQRRPPDFLPLNSPTFESLIYEKFLKT